MTQAFNLSQFANKLNSSGQTDNTGLQNSSVTVTAGTGMSGGGSVALGGSTTLTNAGVTSVAAGTGISVSASTGAVTISSSGGSGTVTSVATGNGLQGGTITTSGTLSLAAPGFNTVGSYSLGAQFNVGGYTYLGTNYAGSVIQYENTFYNNSPQSSSTLSGTWKFMGQRSTGNGCSYLGPATILICRVA